MSGDALPLSVLAPAVFSRARHQRRRLAAALLLTAGYLIFAVWYFDIGWTRLFGGLDRMWLVLRQMLHWQHFLGWDFASMFGGLAQTLAMAFLGTLMAALLALPFGLLGARNIIRAGALRMASRRLTDCLRGVDQLIWALIFVRAVGLGPLAGVLAIIVSDVGVFGKLFSEAVENAEPGPVEGVRSTGGGRAQEIRYGILPQVLPVMLSQVLYIFESNTRSATILGVVGAGGIGLQLSERIRVQYWDQAAFIILVLLATVALIDALSRRLRTLFIGRAVD